METTNDLFTVTVSRVDDEAGGRNPFKKYNQTFTNLVDAVTQAELARLAIEHKYASSIADELGRLMVEYATPDEPYDTIWAHRNDESNPGMYVNPVKPFGKAFYCRYAESPLDYMITVMKTA